MNLYFGLPYRMLSIVDLAWVVVSYLTDGARLLSSDTGRIDWEREARYTPDLIQSPIGCHKSTPQFSRQCSSGMGPM